MDCNILNIPFECTNKGITQYKRSHLEASLIRSSTVPFLIVPRAYSSLDSLMLCASLSLRSSMRRF